MAAPKTVPHSPASFNSPHVVQPRRGVLTLSGYGISVRVDRGHLTIEDGIGNERRRVRLARVGHKLERLIIVGLDGVVSLAALRWLADQQAALMMLERDGKVLFVTGPARPSDVRVRRAQALAHQSGLAIELSRDLIAQKLEAQERIAAETFRDSRAAAQIAAARQALSKAHTTSAIGGYEAKGALVYWRLWEQVPIAFPQGELARVPEHWRRFGSRGSPLSGSPRLAATPVNAVLNYLYALLEAEARLAAVAIGLDPELGFLHSDLPSRDSLAADLMEPIRPHVDAYVLRWLTSQPLRRGWFFETRTGQCRLTAPCLDVLSATATTWARAVAPVVERVHQAIWATARGTTKDRRPATRLTQRHRREMWGSEPLPPPTPPPTPPRLCRECGGAITRGQFCQRCAGPTSSARLVEAAKIGRHVALSSASRAKMSAARLRIRKAEREWSPSQLPAWLTKQFYVEQVQPKLVATTNRGVMSSCRLSRQYAIRVRHGRVTPHPRHWLALAQLAGVSPKSVD